MASARGVESRKMLQAPANLLYTELGDRQSSLLPGQVRTPKYPAPFPICDWTATSSVWGDDDPSDDNGRNATFEKKDDMSSVTTPLAVYDGGEVWSMNGNIAGSHCRMSTPFVDTLKKTNDQAPIPRTATVGGSINIHHKIENSGSDKRRSIGGKAKISSGRLAERQLPGREKDKTLVTDIGMAAPMHAEPSTPSHQQQSGTYTASRIKFHQASTQPISSLEEFASSIIAAAGLPMSMVSLADYITEGQPQLPKQEHRGNTGGTVGQSYTHIHPPPQGCSWNPPRQLESCTPKIVNGQLCQTAWNAPLQVAHPNTHVVSMTSSVSPVSHTVARKVKTQSEFLSDLLYFHANFFPPPPPPRVPLGTRRSRAELWYHYASKWDITHRLPPPPRTPLPEMEMERRECLQELTRTPYHGDRWLKICERWFDVAVQQFEYPAENTVVPVTRSFVLQHVIAG